MNKTLKGHAKEFAAGGLVVCLVVFGFVAYKYFSLIKENRAQYSNIENLNQTVTTLEASLFEVQGEKTMLEEAYVNEKNRNDEFENQIRKISGTVGTLEKLSKTDPELLQKYSKVYFLNEHYIPSGLITIPSKYSYPPDKKLEFHSSAWPFLEELLENAEEDKIDLKIVSAYRSFGTQAALKSSYKVIYGAGTANTFSADQGYSEHQLGTTVDFTTTTLGNNFNAFNTSEAYKWLQENAHKYGFIISYPKTNAYYQFEPWHWRFVGEELSRKLKDDNANFYDTDQRAIDEYLVSIFD